MKKYELIGEEEGSELYRIRALIDIPNHDVFSGCLGGYVEGEHNLSHEGDAWVYEDARVYGDARIYGDALAYGDAQVYGDALVSGSARVYGDAQVYGPARIYRDALITSSDDFIVVGPVGSRKEYLTAYKTVDGSLCLVTGCFVDSLEEFRDSLDKRHRKNSIHWRRYSEMCNFLENFFK